jgi:hypothetical protein
MNNKINYLNELKILIINKGIKFIPDYDSKKQSKDWILDLREVLLDSYGVEIITKILKNKLKKYTSNYLAGVTLASTLVCKS